MRNIARLPESDRRELFRNTADKMGLNDAIVEKDCKRQLSQHLARASQMCHNTPV